MNQLSQIVLLVLFITQLIVPARYLLWPLWCTMLYLPAEDCFLLGSFHLYPLQIIGIAGVLACFIKNNYRRIDLNTIDKLVVLWLVAGSITYSLLWGTEGLIWKAGRLTEFVPCYWLIRNHIQNWKILLKELKVIAILSLFLLPLIIYEHATATNMFYLFGRIATAIREGRLRCSGPFSHPILFGSFAAGMVPVLWSICIVERKYRYGYIFILATLIYYTIASASSGPVLSLIFGILFLSIYILRKKAKIILICVFIVLLSLHMVMKVPVWFLMARVNLFSGSTGWHRANLIDQTVRHFDEWALLGIKSVEPWGIYAGDVTNQFILEGVRGGLLTMLLFCAIIILSIKYLGQFSIVAIIKSHRMFIWGLCSSILVDCVSFMSVSFFGQMTIFFILFLVIAALARDYLDKNIYDIGL